MNLKPRRGRARASKVWRQQGIQNQYIEDKVIDDYISQGEFVEALISTAATTDPCVLDGAIYIPNEHEDAYHIETSFEQGSIRSSYYSHARGEYFQETKY